MNLNALYDLVASRANPQGLIDLPTWSDIARVAEVNEYDDALALRGLIDKGAIDRIPVRNTFGDYRYMLRRPAEGMENAFRAQLRNIGGNVRSLRA